mgnify:CR=1 FL=1
MNIFLHILLITVISIQFLCAESPLSDRYHTYQEIDSILHQWNEEFGDPENSNSPYSDSGIIYKLIDLGVSTSDELPFWAVKLSFNANLDEDENECLNLLKNKIDNIMQTQAKYDMECG